MNPDPSEGRGPVVHVFQKDAKARSNLEAAAELLYPVSSPRSLEIVLRQLMLVCARESGAQDYLSALTAMRQIVANLTWEEAVRVCVVDGEIDWFKVGEALEINPVDAMESWERFSKDK